MAPFACGNAAVMEGKSLLAGDKRDQYCNRKKQE
jgi:hypothetical protein